MFCSRLIAMAVFLAAGFVGCEEADPSSASPAAEPPVGPNPDQLDVAADLVSIDPQVAVSNLVSHTDAALAAVADQPGVITHRSQAIDLLLSRTRFLGSYADFAAALRLAEDAVGLLPREPEAFLARAAVRSAIHEFGPARTDVVEASQLAGEHVLGADKIQQRHAVLDLAIGADLNQAIANAEQAAAQHATFSSLTTLASLLAAEGRFDEADARYLEAARTYRDVSPFPLAWLAFQRGVMWGEMADRPDLALLLYRQAVVRLPHYVVANVHLAEIEAEIGSLEAAVSRLRRVAMDAQDPEPSGLLAELLAEDAPDESDGLIARAAAQYDALLQQFPAAFADHGAEFFAGPGGDPARAVELALGNLQRRPTARSFQVAIGAARAANRRDLLCMLYRDSAKAAETNPSLRHSRAEIAAECAPPL